MVVRSGRIVHPGESNDLFPGREVQVGIRHLRGGR